jgi:ATP-dependent phosphoenolpyruvate carboxykinase
VLDASAPEVWWGEGSPNKPIDENAFLRLRERALDYLTMLDEVFVFDGYAGWYVRTSTGSSCFSRGESETRVFFVLSSRA